MEIGNISMNLKATEMSGLSSEDVKKIQKKYGKNKIFYQNKLKDFFSENFLYLSISSLVFIYSLLMLYKIYSQNNIINLGYLSVTMLVIFSILIEAVKYNLFCKKMKEMNEYQKAYVDVKRDGIIKNLRAEELVVGDIIRLKSGNIVPADCRILESNHMVFDEYWMNEKSHNIVNIKKKNEITQFVFAGSLVKSGTAIAEVTNIGQNMKIGKKIEMLIACQNIKNSILGKYELYIKRCANLFCFIILGLFVLGIQIGGNYNEILMVSLCLLITASSNTIPSIIKLYFLLSSKKLIENGIYVNNIGSLEKMQDVNIVCLEKNQFIKDLYVDQIKSPYYEKDKKFTMILMCMGISLNEDNNLQGVRIDKALLKEADKMKLSLKNINRNLEKVDFQVNEKSKKENSIKEFGSQEIELVDYESFDSDKKIYVCVYKMGSKYRIIVKGASNCVLKKCNRFYENKKVKYIRDKDLFKFQNQMINMESKGNTVIAVAYKDIENIDIDMRMQSVTKDLIYAGAVSFKNELNEKLFEEIKELNNKNIKTLLFTGDSKQTAKKIAEKIGMNITQQNMISGEELECMSDLKLKKKIRNYLIFSRINEYQKSRVIQLLKQEKNTICIVGSKIDDIEAMNEADVRISMDNRS